jgi:hypothetical protein
MQTPALLTEDDVVNAVCAYLETLGWEIVVRATTTQRGPDIVARREPGHELVVEAKGATSARRGSPRFGRPFDSAQVRVHVAEALYVAATTLAHGNPTQRAAVALPDDVLHHRFIDAIAPLLRRLEIAVFWVDGLGDVQCDRLENAQ